MGELKSAQISARKSLPPITGQLGFLLTGNALGSGTLDIFERCTYVRASARNFPSPPLKHPTNYRIWAQRGVPPWWWWSSCASLSGCWTRDDTCPAFSSPTRWASPRWCAPFRGWAPCEAESPTPKPMRVHCWFCWFSTHSLIQFEGLQWKGKVSL